MQKTYAYQLKTGSRTFEPKKRKIQQPPLQQVIQNYKEKQNSFPIQRRVCLLRNQFSSDFVENTSIDYAYKRAHGSVELFPSCNFSTIPPSELLYFVGHGGIGSSGDYQAPVIADALTHPTTGLQNSIPKIVFTSCHAGEGGVTSVVETVKNKLTEKDWDIPVEGAMGSSVKSDATGEKFLVVAPYTPSPGKLSPSDLQRTIEQQELPAIKARVIADLSAPSTLPGRISSRASLAESINRAASINNITRLLYRPMPGTPVDKAAYIASITARFYREFKTALESGGYLLSDANAMNIK